MEIFALVLIWPILVLVLGIVLISIADFGIFGYSPVLAALVLIFLLAGVFKRKANQSQIESLENLRRGIIAFSISLLLPFLIRYIFLATDNSLFIVLSGLAFSFLLIIWGMFIRDNKTLTYANVIGGGLTLLYVYSQIWNLGEVARIAAAAAGLVVAIIIAVVKFRDKFV